VISAVFYFLAVLAYDYTKATIICWVIRLHRARQMCGAYSRKVIY